PTSSSTPPPPPPSSSAHHSRRSLSPSPAEDHPVARSLSPTASRSFSPTPPGTRSLPSSDQLLASSSLDDKKGSSAS
ncbi:MAG: hypothetical protein Q8P67_25215, partial [archaeon]|nr:hypothetical protein [archaeon]